MTQKLVILGAGGQVGRACQRALQHHLDVFDLVQFGRDLDICDHALVRATLVKVQPQIVLNAAAFTAVDACESDQARAFATNGDSVAVLAEICKDLDIPLIHLSTDYVFGDDLIAPHAETAQPRPLNVYGRSKADGEAAIRATGGRHLIIRTSWVYGAQASNFFSTMMRLASEREQLTVVEDEISCPTLADDLALCLIEVCQRIAAGSAHYGTFHVTGSQGLSRRAFAQEIMNARANLGLSYARIDPTTQANFGALARRPKDSRMDCSRFLNAYGMQPRPLRDCLSQLVQSISKQIVEPPGPTATTQPLNEGLIP
jgi:dTDP-4-dehydrorhamnose reductase